MANSVGYRVWQMSEAVRAAEMSQAEFFEAESCMHRSMVMVKMERVDDGKHGRSARCRLAG